MSSPGTRLYGESNKSPRGFVSDEPKRSRSQGSSATQLRAATLDPFLVHTCPLKVLSPDGASFLLTQLCPLVIEGCALMAALSALIAAGAHDTVSPVGWQS